MRLLNRVMTWLRREDGQTLIEYGLIAALISIVIVGAFATGPERCLHGSGRSNHYARWTASFRRAWGWAGLTRPAHPQGFDRAVVYGQKAGSETA